MKKVYETLKTKYYYDLNKDAVWDEYPRPSMVRDSYMCLNGYWDFAECAEEMPTEFTEKILVPFPPESLLSEIQRQPNKKSSIFYRRFFHLPKNFLQGRFILHFGAVDTFTRVYLNGQLIAEHTGGYIPFSVDCTELIKEENNELIVKARGDLTRTYPYGKKKEKRGGMWYTPTSGIWQTVWAESVPEDYIRNLRIEANLHTARICAEGLMEDAILRLTESGEIFTLTDGGFTVCPANARLWSPEDPYLYSYEIISGEDRVKGYFALREIGIKDFLGTKRLTLNGKPYLFNGLLDQGYYPDGILLPATAEGYLNDILTAKSLGFNTLRKHIKIEPEIFYYLCDKNGMVVFQDMVNNANYSFLFDTVLPTIGMKRFPDKILHRSKKTRKIFIDHMLETIRHLNKFPCVLYYTVFNEGWGQFCADKAYAIAKKNAPDRIIDSTSGWFYQKDSDVDSRHVYFKPIKISAHSDRPIVISEFGGYSHRVDGHLFGEANYGYRIVDSIDRLNKDFEALYLNEVLPSISLGVCGLVYTQISDVEDETNGVITYDRSILKLYPEKTKSIMNKLYEELERVTK